MFWVDEKTAIQALDRTQPSLPLKKGRCGTMTHDSNGTATLFAALKVSHGAVISMCDDRHRRQEWLHFLRVIDQVTPAGKDLHLIADNHATHKHPKVQRRLKRHPRFYVHFTPTSSSWLNMVGRFFRDLTQNRLRRGVFRDVEELIMAIGDYIDRHNQNPKPFIWTSRASDTLEKVKRARRSIRLVPHGRVRRCQPVADGPCGPPCTLVALKKTLEEAQITLVLDFVPKLSFNVEALYIDDATHHS